MNRTFRCGLVLLAVAAVAVFTSTAWAAHAYSGAPSPAAHGGGSSPGYLGVDLRDLSEEQVSAIHQHDARGAEIVLVDHDAPAGKAGLREHDVVLRINGQAIVSQDQAPSSSSSAAKASS
jgi:serine protease Do